MIVSMRKVRILGPRSLLPEVLVALQDVGAVHPCRPEAGESLQPVALTPRQERHRAVLRRALEDIEEALAQLGVPSAPASSPASAPAPAAGADLPREVRFARRLRVRVQRLTAERMLREAERGRLAGLARVLEAFVDLGSPRERGGRRAFLLVLSGDAAQGVERIERAAAEVVGDAFALETRPLPGGERAVALLVPARAAERVEALLPDVGVGELELPEEIADRSPAEAAAGLRARLAEVDEILGRLARACAELAERHGERLQRARALVNDVLLQLEVLAQAAATAHAFVFEGWLPESGLPRLVSRLEADVGERVVVEPLARETWSAVDAPVSIVNPRPFRPFEVITRWMPLPAYGTIDPTPYVAVFFPMFFGLILGDLGYGAVLAAVSGAVRWRSRVEGVARSVSEIGLVCAAFSMVFGALFGELFGDLGHRTLGLEPLAFAREEALVPFLALAVSLGFVHVTLGLVLAAFASLRSEPRHSLGSGLAALMLVLTAAVLLAALELLPDAFFTPAVVALLVLFPILIAVEGAIAPIELLSRISNILSYARIMALGTASVMLAMVANRFVGMGGGAVVGVLFATLFHLVNFALGVFSPTIHALRLHFVEFFGTFYSPGGLVYRPFRHWVPADAPAPSTA